MICEHPSGFTMTHDLDTWRLWEIDAFMFDGPSMRIHSAEEIDQIGQHDLYVWCLRRAIYSIVTTELVAWIKEELGDMLPETIEIAAGHGALGEALGIRSTDSGLQLLPEVQAFYAKYRQPTVRLGPCVERIEAVKAVETYRPRAVVGLWATPSFEGETAPVPLPEGHCWGVNHRAINALVEKNILVSNASLEKDINRRVGPPSRVLAFPWLRSRSLHRSKDRIYIWEK